MDQAFELVYFVSALVMIPILVIVGIGLISVLISERRLTLRIKKIEQEALGEEAPAIEMLIEVGRALYAAALVLAFIGVVSIVFAMSALDSPPSVLAGFVFTVATVLAMAACVTYTLWAVPKWRLRVKEALRETEGYLNAKYRRTGPVTLP